MTATIQTIVQQAKSDFLNLAGMVEHAMIQSMGALLSGNFEQSKAVIENDILINAKRYQIEISTMKAIAAFQPQDKDLRFLTSVFDLCAEMERVGDYAKGIATINLRSRGIALPFIQPELDFMGQKVIDLFNRAVTAFVNEDEQAARQVIQEDALIDASYERIYYEMLDYAMEKPERMEQANYVTWISHNLERTADRATNICERTVYVITAEREIVPMR